MVGVSPQFFPPPMDGTMVGSVGTVHGGGLPLLHPHILFTCCRILETMGELCWSNTLERISSPASTLSTSLQRQEEPAHWVAQTSSHLFICPSVRHSPVQPFAGGDKGLVEVGEAVGPSFHCLQIQAVAALQVLVRDAAEPIGATERAPGGESQQAGTGNRQGTGRRQTDPHLSTGPSGTDGPRPVGLSPTEVPEKLVEPERGGNGGFSSSPSAMGQ